MIFRKSRNIEWKTVGKETIIFSSSNGHFYELNDLATFLWKCINGKRKASEIQKLVLNRFDVTESVSKTHITQYIDTLLNKKLIEINK